MSVRARCVARVCPTSGVCAYAHVYPPPLIHPYACPPPHVCNPHVSKPHLCPAHAARAIRIGTFQVSSAAVLRFRSDGALSGELGAQTQLAPAPLARGAARLANGIDDPPGIDGLQATRVCGRSWSTLRPASP